MVCFTDRIRGFTARLRRAYYVHVVFAQVDADLALIVLGPDVCRNFHLVEPQRLQIGAGSVLNGDCYINAQGGVLIGRYCHIAKGLTILSSNHNYNSPISIPYDHNDVLRPVIIGEAVWIGANVSISPGSHIGDGAIVALGAVVRGEVPSCAIVSGNPARVVGWRNRELFKHLLQQGALL